MSQSPNSRDSKVSKAQTDAALLSRLEAEQSRREQERAIEVPESLSVQLERCIRAVDLIIPAQASYVERILATKNEIERKAYEWQYWYIETHVLRAAEIARRRLEYLKQIETESDIEFEMAKCANGVEGTIHWFDMYAWGLDPRSRSPLKVVPFSLFPMQEDFIRWVEKTAFEEVRSGLAEKCRDAGATDSFLRWSIKQYLFRRDFSALLLTETEDKVDSAKDTNTLFGRIRFQFRLLPKWQLPAGFDFREHIGHMKVSHPDETNHAQLIGKAPTPHVGRSFRTTVVLCDEFAFWPGGGYDQDKSFSETSPCIFKVSSVCGKFNQFYETRFPPEGGECNLFVMDWRQHPFKTQAWYNSLPFGYVQEKMRADTIAQEIDRNYEASQPGRVWPHFNDAFTVITVSEARRFYAQHGVYFPDDGDGRVRIPLDWNTARLNDRGATPGHRNAWLWAAAPREHQPLADTVFLYREWLAPLGITFPEIAETVHEFEEQDGEDDPNRMLLSLNSHEAESERVNYEIEHDLYLQGWKTDAETGIAQVHEYLTVIDKEEDNPFRPELLGRTRLIILVADGQGELLKRENGDDYAKTAKDELGMMNLRRQISGLHYPPEEAGKPVGKMRPRKIDNDLTDCLLALAVHWDALHARQTDDEKIKQRLKNANPNMVIGDIMRIADPEQRRAALNSYDVHYGRLQQEAKPKRTGSFWADQALNRQRDQSQEQGRYAQLKRIGHGRIR